PQVSPPTCATPPPCVPVTSPPQSSPPTCPTPPPCVPVTSPPQISPPTCPTAPPSEPLTSPPQFSPPARPPPPCAPVPPPPPPTQTPLPNPEDAREEIRLVADISTATVDGTRDVVGTDAFTVGVVITRAAALYRGYEWTLRFPPAGIVFVGNDQNLASNLFPL